ncbi:MAG: AraC family transcriptional regulator [Kiritimatiellae bacterium]|nr:AraC family transcriptional regulator [Kiritimatiellia bacterium]
MRTRKRLTDTTDFKREDLPPLTPEETARRREAFFKAAGGNLRLLMQFAETLPETGVTIKDAQGYIYFKNRRALELMNLTDDSTIVGRRAQHIYPRHLWRVYIDREEPSLRTGEPMIDKVYGYVADLSTALNRVSVFPVRNGKGTIIGLVTSHYRVRSKESAPNWYDTIKDAITYVSKTYASDISVADLARRANLSESQFTRIFRRQTETSPAHYIVQTRINAARTLLETTDKLLTDIATETGFYDHAHFIRTFKRLVGMTPSRYRKQHWTGLGKNKAKD